MSSAARSCQPCVQCRDQWLLSVPGAGARQAVVFDYMCRAGPDEEHPCSACDLRLLSAPYQAPLTSRAAFRAHTPTFPSSSAPAAVVGTCIACGGPWDDYRHRRRCPCCRMLVLMCDACAAALPEPSQGCVQADAGAGGAQQQQQQQLVRHPVCDLCQRRQQQAKRGAAAGSSSAGRLRILCLHGFRQSARNFEVSSWSRQALLAASPLAGSTTKLGCEFPSQPKVGSGWACWACGCGVGLTRTACCAFCWPAGVQGRTHALRRRLKDLAEFVFIDAPHQLPAWTKPGAGEEAAPEGSASVCGNAATTAQAAAAQAAAQEQQDPVPASAQPRAEPAAALEQQALEAAEGGRLHRLPREVGQRQGQRGWPPRRAWMLVPEQYAALRAGQQHQEGYEQQHQEGEEQQLQQQQAQTQERRQLRDEAPPAAVPASYVDEWQLQRQTDGWQESWLVLEAALREQGPFDGVMGFSQGAAVAAVLAAQVAAERQRQRQQVAEGCVGAGSADGASLPQPMLRFAILCSGYISPVEEHGRLLQAAATMGGAALPTLHIYGSGEPGVHSQAECVNSWHSKQARPVLRHSISRRVFGLLACAACFQRARPRVQLQCLWPEASGRGAVGRLPSMQLSALSLHDRRGRPPGWHGGERQAGRVLRPRAGDCWECKVLNVCILQTQSPRAAVLISARSLLPMRSSLLSVPPLAAACLQRFVMRHSSGHIIPSNKTALHRIREFLLHVQQQEHQLRVQQ